MVFRPRTSRHRGGHAFVEHRTNAWAALIGFLLGRGYSSFAVAEVLADGTDPAMVREMARKWGLRNAKFGDADAYLVVPVTVRQRANLAARAAQHELSVEEYCRRLLICASMPKDRYDDLVAKDQFE